MSVASVKIMHINVHTQMSQDHCLDRAQQSTQHSNNHQIQTSTDCHHDLAINLNVDHKKCQECSSLSCQTQISCLHSLQSSLDPLDTFYSIDQPNFYYLNQYLNGYWQEISRPPKT